jgi:Na+-driven multidrug efflux pump
MTDLKNDGSFLRKIYFPALFPNIIAVLGGTINVFFDGILVGQKLGDIGLQAVNQSLPIYLILCTIGSLLASGASILSSVAFGKEDKKEAQRIFNGTLWMSMLVSVAVCVIGFIFSSGISSIISTPETYEYVLTYVRITVIGGIFKIMLYMSYFYLRLEGKNKRLMSAMLLMTVLNIILDYVFLFVFNLEMVGAAWASVIATAIACLVSFVFLFTGNSNFKPSFCLLKTKDLTAILRYGSPMALNNVLSSARVLAINLILKTMGMSSLLTIFAVVNNLNEFSICIQNGVPQTASAMTGVLCGEKDSLSIKRLLKLQIFSGVALSAVLAVLFTAFPSLLARAFGSEVDCTFAIVCFSVGLLFATFNSIMSYHYNAIGRISMANVIILCRGLITVAGFFLLSTLLGEKIWLMYPAAEVITSIIFVLIGLYVSRAPNVSRFYLIDESFERAGTDISFTVECDNEKICEASEKIRDFCDENEFAPKKAMAISLAIEEILTIISEKSLMGHGNLDVRVIKSGENGIIRIRSGGKRYDPFESQDDSLDYMGVQMISKLATDIQYLSVLGVNTLIISI